MGAVDACLCKRNFLFFFCLAVVGFIPMLANFLLSCWSYSCYLTIREKEIVIYLVLLGFGSIQGGLSLMHDVLGNFQVLGKIINLVTYCMLMFIVGKCYYAFRHSGGLRGMGQKSAFLEDQILKTIVLNGEIIAVKSVEVVD